MSSRGRGGNIQSGCRGYIQSRLPPPIMIGEGAGHLQIGSPTGQTSGHVQIRHGSWDPSEPTIGLPAGPETKLGSWE